MKKPNSLFRVILFPIAASIALASFAFGDDTTTKNNTETTHDVSKNPLTGKTTDTTTTESEVKVGATTKKRKTVKKKKFNKEGVKIKEESDTTSETHQ